MILETDRLLLREFVPDDRHAVWSYQRDPLYLQYYEWPDRTPEEVDYFVQGFIRQAQEEPRKVYQLAICSRATGTLVGNCGIRLAKPHDEQADMGFELGPSHWGLGFATEAARALLRFGFQDLRLHRIWARCVADNLRSANVLRKAGLRLEARLREHEYFKGRWWDTLLFGILVAEWDGDRRD
jgi:RimJ/RimL family protein N-acetyltransferase